jgi:hypothetical protein
MIKLEISEDARDYILNNAAAITIESLPMFSCGGYSNKPLIFEYKPSASENYKEVMVDGIKVYLFKEGAVIDTDGIRIYLSGDSYSYRCLQVEGLDYEDY